MNKVYLLLGSNMGHSSALLQTARTAIAKELGEIIRQSSIYKTAAWGNTNQPPFLNQVLVLATTLAPVPCLEKLLAIEAIMGRVRTIKNAPRIIDIDMLYYNKLQLSSPTLILPHPAIAQRRFVLTPLNEIAPSFIHPVYSKTNHQLLMQCDDPLEVKKI
jgi:2-amino-4-hydroxy-6-hydroxymethyldihydropteridine diphosphokinase